MSVEITIKAPHGTALHDKITELLVSGITPVADTTASVAEVVATSDLPLSPTLADAIAIGRAVEKQEAVDAYEAFIDKTRTADAAPLPVSKLQCAVDLSSGSDVGITIPSSFFPPAPKTNTEDEKKKDLGTDAKLWANEFINSIRGRSRLHPHNVVSWFHSAIAAGYAAGLAAQKDKPETADHVRAFETDDDPHTDAARNAQQEHLDEAANLASSAQWQREKLVLEHLRSFVSTGEFNIGIRTVINGGFIVVSTTSGETETSVTDLVSCTSPAELLSAIALICAFAEHG